jgi:putative hydroxymethylpyrimidine transport system substrate-binding protein
MRGRPRLLAALACAVAAALALAGCGGSGSPAAADGNGRALPQATLILDWFPNADHAGVYAAIDRGFFREAGIVVRPQVPSDTAAALKEVAQGKAPFAISYEPEVLLARAEGIPVVAVAALVTAPLNSVIARADRGIARPRDLEGKLVGGAGLPSDRALLDTVVRADGGDPAKVRLRNVGFSLAPALAAGRVDALIGGYWNVEAVEVREKGVPVRVFRLDDHGVPRYDELVVVTSESYAREHPDVVSTLLAGLARGQTWAAAHPAAAVGPLLRANPDLSRPLVTEQVRLVAPLFLDHGVPLRMRPAAWARYAAWMRREGLLRKPVDAAAAMNVAFLQVAPLAEETGP